MSDPGLNNQPGVEPPDEPQMVSPGARLAAYRKERGWTVEQVASQLNLAPRQIVAIESDDYPSLPGMPIVRGFVRAYAKLLKVDAVPLLATLGGETVLMHEPIQPRKTLSTPFSESRMPLMTERPGLSSRWVLGTLLGLLLGVAIWAARHDGSPIDLAKSVSQSGNVESTPSVSGGAQVPADAAQEQASVAPPQTPAAPDVAASEHSVGTASDAAPAIVAPTAPVPVPETAAQATPAAPIAKDALELKVREDSWIEVKRVENNAVLMSRIVKAGENQRIEVSEPISVIIGNASGVEATFRGAPLELKPKANNNVARLSLK